MPILCLKSWKLECSHAVRGPPAMRAPESESQPSTTFVPCRTPPESLGLVKALEPPAGAAREGHHVIVGGFVDDEGEVAADDHGVDAIRPSAELSRGSVRVCGIRLVTV